MLYDERNNSAFLAILNQIMGKLAISDPGIIILENEKAPRYIFRALRETGRLNPAYLNLLAPTQDDPIVHLNQAMNRAIAQIADNDLRLRQLLVSVGRQQFKNWPFIFTAPGQFHDCAELNIIWRGSLRKGICEFANSVSGVSENVSEVISDETFSNSSEALPKG